MTVYRRKINCRTHEWIQATCADLAEIKSEQETLINQNNELQEGEPVRVDAEWSCA